MDELYNIYCDESCHLEHDGEKVMTLGAIWCPLRQTRDIARHIRDIKIEHGLPSTFEVKWTKVSKGKQEDFYLHLIRYFFEDADLHFRALVADKSRLDYETYGHDHSTWYFKMYFDMLKLILSPKDQYCIYLDIKDTCSAEKIEKLHEVLCNNMYDFSKAIIQRVQTVHSYEVEQLQLADLLIGAVSYANRGLSTSPAKLRLVQELRERSGYCLTKSTLYREAKVNIFHWRGQ